LIAGFYLLRALEIHANNFQNPALWKRPKLTVPHCSETPKDGGESEERGFMAKTKPPPPG
jgi:hypothetical protein